MSLYPPIGRAPLWAGLLTGVLVAVLGWPAPVRPSQWVIGGGSGDFASIAWGLWRVADAAPGLPDVHLPDLYFPQGADLLIADLPESLLIAPVTALFGPVVAFNLLQWLHPTLAAVCAAALARSEDVSIEGAVLAGVGFGLSPVLLSSIHNGNPDVSPLFLVPLVALCAMRISQGWTWAIAAGVVAGMSPWFNPYVGVMVAITALIFAPWRARRSWAAGGLAAAIAGAYLLMVRQSLADAATMIVKPPVIADAPSTGAADLIGFVWPAMTLQPDGWSVHLWAPGLILLVLAFGGGRSWRWWILASIGAVMALGPVLQVTPGIAAEINGWRLLLPGALLAQLPGLDALHIQYRFAALTALGLSVLAARAVTRLPRLASRLIIAAAVGELLWIGGGLLASGPAPSTVGCELLADLSDGAIIDLPGEREERRMLAQACHGRPIAEGINQPYPHRVRHSPQPFPSPHRPNQRRCPIKRP
ncbi:MAG: DUF2079 domain-containing protein, partial [Myxococcota bacterium]